MPLFQILISKKYDQECKWELNYLFYYYWQVPDSWKSCNAAFIVDLRQSMRLVVSLLDVDLRVIASLWGELCQESGPRCCYPFCYAEVLWRIRNEANDGRPLLKPQMREPGLCFWNTDQVEIGEERGDLVPRKQVVN